VLDGGGGSKCASKINRTVTAHPPQQNTQISRIGHMASLIWKSRRAVAAQNKRHLKLSHDQQLADVHLDLATHEVVGRFSKLSRMRALHHWLDFAKLHPDQISEDLMHVHFGCPLLHTLLYVFGKVHSKDDGHKDLMGAAVDAELIPLVIANLTHHNACLLGDQHRNALVTVIETCFAGDSGWKHSQNWRIRMTDALMAHGLHVDVKQSHQTALAVLAQKCQHRSLLIDDESRHLFMALLQHGASLHTRMYAFGSNYHMVSILAALSSQPTHLPFLKGLLQEKHIHCFDYMVAEPNDSDLSTAEQAWQLLHSKQVWPSSQATDRQNAMQLESLLPSREAAAEWIVSMHQQAIVELNDVLHAHTSLPTELIRLVSQYAVANLSDLQLPHAPHSTDNTTTTPGDILCTLQ